MIININNKIKSKKYHTIEAVPKSNTTIIKTKATSIQLKDIYRRADFPGLIQAFQ